MYVNPLPDFYNFVYNVPAMKYIIILLVLVVLWLIMVYNRLVLLRNRTKEALSDIDVQSKRRYDLIPNLVETVKGYMEHERSVLENVTAARSAVMGATGQKGKAEAENMLSSTLKSLFAVAENYPQLKANENFMKLQDELSDTENKMQASRRFFNSTAQDLRTKVETFPSNIVANVFGFKAIEFFEVDSVEERKAVKVTF